MKRAWWCAALFLGACSTTCTNASSPTTSPPLAPDAGVEAAAAETPDVELLASFDLARGATTQTLSAMWFDEATRTLFALKDREPSIVPLKGSEDLRTWTAGKPLALTGRPNPSWDGEGLVRSGSEWLAVTDETSPLVERFDLSGKYLGAIETPAHFSQQAANNKGLESLAIAPSGRFLFSANESALTVDGAGPSKSKGTTVRIWRHDLAATKGGDEERAYRTEPLGKGDGGDMGIAELLALSDTALLVLERGFQTGFGNTVRIFRVDFGVGDNVLGAAALGPSSPVLAKTLIVDLVTLPADGIEHPSTQPNPILDNYESLALGPLQPDGRRVVFVGSDDNQQASQVARILVLALRLR